MLEQTFLFPKFPENWYGQEMYHSELFEIGHYYRLIFLIGESINEFKNYWFQPFILGIVYMDIDGWLISWWFIPDYRVAGPSFFTNISFAVNRFLQSGIVSTVGIYLFCYYHLGLVWFTGYSGFWIETEKTS